MKNILWAIFTLFIIAFGLLISIPYSTIGEKKYIIQKSFNKLLIVAHPDDETLWGYHQLKNSKGWKIICITNANNPTRVAEITSIAKHLGTALEVWNFKDKYLNYNMHPKIYLDLATAINQPNVEKVVTHNPLGEYGHTQHKKISQIVLTVSKKPTFVFSYTQNKKNKSDVCNLAHIYKSQHNIFINHCRKNTKNKIYKLR